MNNEYYQIAALLIASSVALITMIFIIRSILSFMGSRPELVVLVSLITTVAGVIALTVPEHPSVFESLLLIATSVFVLFYSAAIYNGKRG